MLPARFVGAVRAVRLYLLLAFGLSWAIWVPVAVLVDDLSIGHHVLVGVAATGPSLAGLLCTAREQGLAGVRGLVASLLAWRLPARWYVLAIGGPLAVALISVGAHRLAVGDDVFELDATTVLLVPVAFVSALFVGSLQEELGWRGYALPRLLDRCTAVAAALVVGVAWALWHLPLYAIAADGQDRAPLALFLLSVVALSLIYTWLWLITNASLLIAVVLHSATNVASALLIIEAEGDLGPHVVATALIIVLAALAGVNLKRRSHAPRPTSR